MDRWRHRKENWKNIFLPKMTTEDYFSQFFQNYRVCYKKHKQVNYFIIS